jgi:hypothetical protein
MGRLGPVVTCVAALSLVGSIDAAQEHSAGQLLRLQVGGRAREALVFAPTAKAANGLVPVILDRLRRRRFASSRIRAGICSRRSRRTRSLRFSRTTRAWSCNSAATAAP